MVVFFKTVGFTIGRFLNSWKRLIEDARVFSNLVLCVIVLNFVNDGFFECYACVCVHFFGFLATRIIHDHACSYLWIIHGSWCQSWCKKSETTIFCKTFCMILSDRVWYWCKIRDNHIWIWHWSWFQMGWPGCFHVLSCTVVHVLGLTYVLTRKP